MIVSLLLCSILEMSLIASDRLKANMNANLPLSETLSEVDLQMTMSTTLTNGENVIFDSGAGGVLLHES